MAPTRRYELPNEQLTRLLAEGRAMGVSFEVAWTAAVRPGMSLCLTNHADPPSDAIRWPTDTTDRHAWQEAIMESKDGYRRAFERRPSTRREAALEKLQPLLASGIQLDAALESAA